MQYENVLRTSASDVVAVLNRLSNLDFLVGLAPVGAGDEDTEPAAVMSRLDNPAGLM